MYGSLAAHLARRGFQAVRQNVRDGPNLSPEDVEAIRRAQSGSTIAVLVITLVVFFGLSVALEYTIRHVVGTLAAVEYVPDEESPEFELDGLLDEDEDEALAGGGGEYKDVRIPVDDAAAKPKNTQQKPSNAEPRLEDAGTRLRAGPVTDGIFATLAHVRRHGGIPSLFRGFRTFIAWCFIYAITSLPIEFALGSSWPWLGTTLGAILGFLAATAVHCRWTHNIIARPPPGRIEIRPRAAPSSGFWNLAARASVLLHFAGRVGGLRRYVPCVWSGHLVLPTIRLSAVTILSVEAAIASAVAIASRMSPELPFFVYMLLGFIPPVLLLTFAALVGIVPATIALARVEAHLLTHPADAVIAFDPSFGGQAATWMSTQVWWRYAWIHLSPIGAWEVFDREVYWRVVKIYVKFGALVLLLAGLMIAVILLELYIILNGRVGLIMNVIYEYS